MLHMKTATILILFSLVIVHSGCEKMLDKEPVDQLSIEATFQDFDGAKAALAGAYTSLFDINYYNGLRSIYPDLTGGNVKHSKTAGIDLLSEYSFASTAAQSEMNATYGALYAILNNLNYIIQKAPVVADGTLAQRNRLVAEATALRALVHFDLLQLYAQPYNYTTDASHIGIVINMEPVFVKSSIIKRSTVKQGYDAVLSDLNQASVLMAGSEIVFTAGNSSNYMNANSINALLARVYLNMEDWNNAYNYAGKVIAVKSYSLYGNANYVNSWTLKNTSESIFEVAVPNNFSGNSYGSYFTPGQTYLQMATTKDLLDLYTATDVRGRDSFYLSSMINGTLYYFSKKYPTAATAATGVKVIRLSEMYLIRAEAAAELGNQSQANADLNLIRQRADVAASALNLNTKDALITAILLERRKELNLEGFLLFDLARRKKNVLRTDCMSNTCNLNYPNAHYILPIPEQSVLTNANMIQNPEY